MSSSFLLSVYYYPFDGSCHCSKDANLSLTFDNDAAALRVNSCLLRVTSPILKKILEDCPPGDGTLHLGRDNKKAWILLLNMVHPIASQKLDRQRALSSIEARAEVGALAKKYDAESILMQLDEALSRSIVFLQQPCRAAYDLGVSKKRATFGDFFSSPGDVSGPYQPYSTTYGIPPPFPLFYPPPLHPTGNSLDGYPPHSQSSFPYFPYRPSTVAAEVSPSMYYGALYSSNNLRNHASVLNTTPDPCTALLPLLEQAVHLNLQQSWRMGIEQFVKIFKRLCLFSHHYARRSASASAKDMLVRLKADGFEKEAVDFSIRFFDLF